MTALTLSDNKVTLNSADIAPMANMVTFNASVLKAGTFDSADVAAWRPTYFRMSSMPTGYAGTFEVPTSMPLPDRLCWYVRQCRRSCMETDNILHVLHADRLC